SKEHGFGIDALQNSNQCHEIRLSKSSGESRFNPAEIRSSKHSRKSPRSRHWAWNAGDVQSLRSPGRAQGVGHTARRDRALSTHRPAVAAAGGNIDHLEAELETKLKSAQALRQSILRDAFSGKLVPQCPSDEPAS